MSRGIKAKINLKNLIHNYKVLSKLAPSKLVLVVKADAYGHGLKQIVIALGNVDCFAVATIEEALMIRKHHATVRILLLEGYLNADELKIAFENKFDSVIHQKLQVDLLKQSKSTSQMSVWLKYDSGMNRLGFDDEEFSQVNKRLDGDKNVKEIILMTHFASANIYQNPFNQLQKQQFLKYKKNYSLSLSNSSALLNQDNLEDEWCRVGLALFGVSPIEPKTAKYYNLKPVMNLQTNIIAIKKVKARQYIGYMQTYRAPEDMKIAIIGIGYGDGYPWSLSDDAFVMINNKSAKIVGRISMDMIAIDISAIKNVDVGDSVLVWGEDENGDLPIEAVAQNANTIPYVLLCQITSRVQYNYD